jgi:uncharacterized membrane protein
MRSASFAAGVVHRIGLFASRPAVYLALSLVIFLASLVDVTLFLICFVALWCLILAACHIHRGISIEASRTGFDDLPPEEQSRALGYGIIHSFLVTVLFGILLQFDVSIAIALTLGWFADLYAASWIKDRRP